MTEKGIITIVLMVITIVAIIAILMVKTDPINDPEIIKENSKKTKVRIISFIFLLCFILLPIVIEKIVGLNERTIKPLLISDIVVRLIIFIFNIALVFAFNIKEKKKYIIILIIAYVLSYGLINAVTPPKIVIH